jgi:hypothetical protein
MLISFIISRTVVLIWLSSFEFSGREMVTARYAMRIA